MAYRKGKKRYYKKKPSRWQIYGAAGGQLLKDVSMLKSIVNAEKKFKDVQGNYNQGTTPTVVHLTPIAEGSGPSERNGITVKASSMMFRAFCKINASATTPCTFRVLIIEDTQNDGSSPAFSDVISGGGIISPLNKDRVPRFKVICDQIYSLTPGASASSLREFKCFRKIHNHIRYSAGLGTDTRAGQFYLMTVSDDATNTPAFRYYSRISYLDN